MLKYLEAGHAYQKPVAGSPNESVAAREVTENVGFFFKMLYRVVRQNKNRAVLGQTKRGELARNVHFQTPIHA